MYNNFTKFCNEYIFFGFSFPCIKMNDSNKKVPVGMIKWKTVDITTTDQFVNPDHKGFVIITGAKSNVTVIDCDSIASYNSLIKKFPQLVNTLTVNTFKGKHIYCRYNAEAPTSANCFNDFDSVDLRNDNGIIFAPFTSYSRENSTVIYSLQNNPGKLVDFPIELLSNLKTKIKPTVNSVKRTYAKFPDKDPPVDQLNVFWSLLNELTPNYYCETKLWLDVGRALHWSSNSKAMFNLWVKFSKKSKKHKPQLSELKTRWCTWNSDIPNPKTVAALKFFHKNLKVKTDINYDKLSIPKSYDVLKGVDSIPNLTIENVCRQHVWDNNHFNRNFIPTENTILGLGFDTGFGKSYYGVKILNHLHVPPIIPTPRIVFAKQCAKQFNCRLYTDIIHEKGQHGVNEVIQIDSLLRMKNVPDENYLLFLDEFDQTVEHLLATLDTMAQNRIFIVAKLTRLIRKAKYVIIADANLTYRSLHFLRNISPKPIHLVINTKVIPRDQAVNVFSNLKTIRNDLITAIKHGRKVYICSDRREAFEQHVIVPIKHLFPNLKCKFYSKTDGDDADFDNVNVNWFDCYCVSVSPKVTSGIDYNPIDEFGNGIRTHAVYAIYFGGGSDALKNNQQINRIRNPTEINIYCSKLNRQNFYTKKACESNIDDIVNATGADIHINDKCLVSELEIVHHALRDLVVDSNLLSSYLSNHIDFHIIDLLKKKGYSNFSFIDSDSMSDVPKELTSAISYEAYCLKKVQLQSNTKMFNTFLEDFPHVEPDTIDYIMADPHLYNSALRWKKYINVHLLKNSKNDDIVNASFSIDNKIWLAKQVSDALGLTWLRYDIMIDFTHVKRQHVIMLLDDLIREIFGVFKIFRKMGKVKDASMFVCSYWNVYQLLMRMLDELFPRLIVKGVIPKAIKLPEKNPLIVFGLKPETEYLHWNVDLCKLFIQ